MPEPVFVPGDRVFAQGQPARVALDCSDPAAVLRYTRDGSDPGPDAPRYTQPLTLTQDTVLTARAFLPDGAAASLSRRNTASAGRM